MLVAVTSGLPVYMGLDWVGEMPPALRDRPWPMEVLAGAATCVTIVIAMLAHRRRQGRPRATLSAVVAVLATSAFVLYVHELSYRLPPPPKDIAVGTMAPDFTLPDETGRPVVLSSLRGHPTLLVFYRGYW
jgi:hypothetical protein